MSGVRTPGLLFVAETGQDDGLSPETVIRGMGGRAGVAVALILIYVIASVTGAWWAT